ncbi:MAG: hypothetical protein Q8P73_00725 [bacterium]|nr:hypothetical protein [bacterium]
MIKISRLVMYLMTAFAVVGLVTLATVRDRQANAQAEEEQISTSVPLVYAENLQAQVQANGDITGTFLINNQDGNFVGDIGYAIQLLGSLPEIPEGELVSDTAPVYDQQTQSEVFSLAPDSTKEVVFNYKPVAVPTGDYRLRVQLITSNGRRMGWDTAPIQLSGEDSFVLIESSYVETKGTDRETGEERNDWGPLEGVNVNAKQRVVLHATVQNVGAQSVTVTPRVETTRLLTENIETFQITDKPIVLTAGEEKDISVTLEAASEPGSYAAMLILQDENGQRVSSLAEFRYVVRGMSASVVSASFKAIPRKAGETAVVDFTVVGPADMEQEINGLLEVSVLDGEEIVGSVSENVVLNAAATSGLAQVKLDRNIEGTPGLRIVLKSQEGVVLDTYDYILPGLPAAEAEAAPVVPYVNNWQISKTLAAFAVLIVVLIILAVVIVWVIWKRKKKTPPEMIILLVLLIGSALVIGSGVRDTRAGIQLEDTNYNEDSTINLFVNRPIHDPQGNHPIAAGAVSYEASMSYLACDNEVASTGAISVNVKKNGGTVSFKPNSAVDQSQNTSEWQLAGSTSRQDRERGFGHTYFPRSLYLSANLDLSNFAGVNTTIWTKTAAQRIWRNETSREYKYDFTWVKFVGSLACSASNTTPNVGENVTFSATGGNPAWSTYKWSVDESPKQESGSASFAQTFSSLGKKAVQVQRCSSGSTTQTSAPATRTWNSGEPGDLRVFVNSLAAQEGYSQVPSVLKYDSVTAQKVCALAGYSRVASMSCTSKYDGGRCGWSSPWDNTLSYWNGSNFITGNAAALGNQWLTNLTCADPIPTPTRCEVAACPAVTVSGQPTVDLTVDQNQVNVGDQVTVSWITQNTNYCDTGDSSMPWGEPNTQKNAAGGSELLTLNQEGIYTFAMECGADAGNTPVNDAVVVNVTSMPVPQCADGIDNDGDGKIDCEDSGCHWDGTTYTTECDGSDDDETDPAFNPGDIRETE